MFSTSFLHSGKIIGGAVGLAVLGLAATAPLAPAHAGNHVHKAYSYYNNEFIVREQPNGNRMGLTVYRLAGDQWERENGITVSMGQYKSRRGSAMAMRILREGRFLGRVKVDLDNPLNTDLNLGDGGVRR